MADTPTSLASALYPDLPSEAETAPAARPEADSGSERSLAEKIYGEGEPADGLAKAREGIAAGIAKPAAEIEAEAEAAGQGEVGAFGLPTGALTNEFSALVKESGLSEASASKLAKLHTKALTETSNQYWKKTSDDWAQQTRRQFGAGLDATVGTIRPLLADTSLTTPGFRVLLDQYKLGNHPDVVRTLANWARAMGRR